MLWRKLFDTSKHTQVQERKLQRATTLIRGFCQVESANVFQLFRAILRGGNKLNGGYGSPEVGGKIVATAS